MVAVPSHRRPHPRPLLAPTDLAYRPGETPLDHAIRIGRTLGRNLATTLRPEPLLRLGPGGDFTRDTPDDAPAVPDVRASAAAGVNELETEQANTCPHCGCEAKWVQAKDGSTICNWCEKPKPAAEVCDATGSIPGGDDALLEPVRCSDCDMPLDECPCTHRRPDDTRGL